MFAENNNEPKNEPQTMKAWRKSKFWFCVYGFQRSTSLC